MKAIPGLFESTCDAIVPGRPEVQQRVRNDEGDEKECGPPCRFVEPVREIQPPDERGGQLGFGGVRPRRQVGLRQRTARFPRLEPLDVGGQRRDRRFAGHEGNAMRSFVPERVDQEPNGSGTVGDPDIEEAKNRLDAGLGREVLEHRDESRRVLSERIDGSPAPGLVAEVDPAERIVHRPQRRMGFRERLDLLSRTRDRPGPGPIPVDALFHEVQDPDRSLPPRFAISDLGRQRARELVIELAGRPRRFAKHGPIERDRFGPAFLTGRGSQDPDRSFAGRIAAKPEQSGLHVHPHAGAACRSGLDASFDRLHDPVARQLVRRVRITPRGARSLQMYCTRSAGPESAGIHGQRRGF